MRVETLPIEIRESRRAVVWKHETRDGKPTKVPYRAQRTAVRAAVDEPSTWAPFLEAVAAVEDGKGDGVGIVLNGDGLIGIDLDGCVDAAGVVTAAARALVDLVNSYTELTPGGRGLRIFAWGTLPPGRRVKQGKQHTGIEVYETGKYLTISGRHLEGTPRTIEQRTPELATFHTRVFGAAAPADRPRPAPAIEDDDATLIARMQAARNGGKVSSLWTGDITGYPSASEADLALASALAFWTGRDASRMDRLFRQSGLMRAKWDTRHGRDTYGHLTIARAIAGCRDIYQATSAPPGRPAPHTADAWPAPAAIQSSLPPVSAFAEDLVPAAFRSLIYDVSQRMQVPADYAAAATVLCLAGVVSRRARMQPKAHDTTWQVVPNLWGGIVAPPGAMKSPTLEAITRPLTQIQDEWRRECAVATADYARRKEESELRHAAWKQLFTASTKKRLPTPARPEDDADEPTLRRLLVNDSTFEALHETMAGNPAGVLVVRDELTGWLSLLDRPGREGERAFCLEAWNGTTGHTMDRIGRGTVHVEACCMSLLGGIQPGRLRSYLVDALKDGPSNDGLIQRFQLLVWPDMPPAWAYVDQAPDAVSEQRFARVLRRLVALDVRSPVQFLFAADAQALFVDWLSELEARLRGDDLHPALVSHLSKYRKLMPALALLFELADRAACEGFDEAALAQGSQDVSLEHAKQAAAWCEYLESHARRVYSCVTTPQMRAARELAAKITAHKVEARFSCRDVYHKAWSGLDTPELVRLAAELLVDAAWLREVPAESTAAGGRPPARFDVNPKVWG